MQLNVSDLITRETRARTAAGDRRRDHGSDAGRNHGIHRQTAEEVRGAYWEDFPGLLARIALKPSSSNK